MNNLEIIGGAMADPIKKQLETQGLIIDNPETYDKLLNAVTMLNLHGFMADSLATRTRQRIVNKLASKVKSAQSQSTKQRGVDHGIQSNN